MIYNLLYVASGTCSKSRFARQEKKPEDLGGRGPKPVRVHTFFCLSEAFAKDASRLASR